jgi:hypothetical protein
MCPACMASAALIAGSVTTTGGVSAFVVKIMRKKKSVKAGISKDPANFCKEK